MASGIVKFSDTSCWDFGMEAVSLIKDAKSLVKRASSKELLKFAKTKGQEDLHVIALGAYEGTGFNRNLDRFVEHWCEKNAHYFKDSDRCVHRHHKNKPDSPKYGNVKAAAYNKDMKRIELVIGLDTDKCSDILHEQEKVGHTNWSMASKQAYDTCTWCNHKAYSDDDRCEHIPAKLGELNKQGEMCGMDNPDPRWFEISYVKRPADRIGMSLQKLSSAYTPMLPKDYLSIYTDFHVPGELTISKSASAKRDLLQKLSEIEKRVEAMSLQIPKSSIIAKTEKLATEVMDELRKISPDLLLKAAADKGIILSPDNFFGYVFADRIKQADCEGAKTHIQDIFQTIEKDAGEIVNSEVFDVAARLTPSDVSRKVDKLAKELSIFKPYILARTLNKEAADSVRRDKTDSKLDFELAKQYASYKLAALNYLDEQNKLTDDILLVSVLQNKVC
jgi:hypothetical protein